jgi:hypothetical protein
VVAFNTQRTTELYTGAVPQGTQLPSVDWEDWASCKQCVGQAAPLDALVHALRTACRARKGQPAVVVLLSGGLGEVQGAWCVADARLEVEKATQASVHVLYLGCRHDAACAREVGVPAAATLRFAPCLGRAALRAAAEAIVSAAADAFQIQPHFTADHRLFANPRAIAR